MCSKSKIQFNGPVPSEWPAEDRKPEAGVWALVVTSVKGKGWKVGAPSLFLDLKKKKKSDSLKTRESKLFL